jgi:hypothetical protein
MLSSPSNVILLTTKAEVALDNPALSLDSNLEQLIGVENVHATGDEGEVVAAAGNGELADEDAGGVPAVERVNSDVCSMEDSGSTYTLIPSPPPHAE